VEAAKVAHRDHHLKKEVRRDPDLMHQVALLAPDPKVDLQTKAVLAVEDLHLLRKTTINKSMKNRFR
jgi:hypothetical protein